MAMRFLGACALAAVLAVGGCYHATIETDAVPSSVTIDKGWASGWIFGLVPPSTVSTAAQCPGGVAKVETELSFLNQLVSAVTLGIYTPMHIKVTCAEGAKSQGFEIVPDFQVQPGATDAEVQETMQLAATEAARAGRVVYVQF
jgi:Bor protein